MQTKIRWIFFDLDDTLYDFRQASQCAVEAVCDRLHLHGSRIASAELADTYRFSATTQAEAFIDGRSSRHYRTERFLAMLEQSKLPASLVDGLLDVFETRFIGTIRPFNAIVETLNTLHIANYRLAVVSEGVQDTQERTLQRLGIVALVEFLMTSNREGVSKPNGLFERATARAGAPATECVVVGDSYAKDFVPAAALGMQAVLFHPRGSCLSNYNAECFSDFAQLPQFLAAEAA